jgi:hypothetical protein
MLAATTAALRLALVHVVRAVIRLIGKLQHYDVYYSSS